MKPGMKVFLKEDKTEGWPRQEATIIEVYPENGYAMVEVEPMDDSDDGLREVGIGQIENTQQRIS